MLKPNSPLNFAEAGIAIPIKHHNIREACLGAVCIKAPRFTLHAFGYKDS